MQIVSKVLQKVELRPSAKKVKDENLQKKPQIHKSSRMLIK